MSEPAVNHLKFTVYVLRVDTTKFYLQVLNCNHYPTGRNEANALNNQIPNDH